MSSNSICSGLDKADKFVHCSTLDHAPVVYDMFFKKDHPNCPVFELDASKVSGDWVITRKFSDPHNLLGRYVGERASRSNTRRGNHTRHFRIAHFAIDLALRCVA